MADTDEARNIIQDANGSAVADSAIPYDDDTTIENRRNLLSQMARDGNFVTMTVDQVYSQLVAPWFSKYRDYQLRCLSREVDYLASGFYNAITLLTGIMPGVAPLDRLNDVATLQSKISTILLHRAWIENIPGFLFDVFSQDNGGFLEITSMDSTKVTRRPLEPTEIAPGLFIPATGLRMLDSSRCYRTGDPELPVRVEWFDGEEYYFHHSRIIEWAHMPSTDPEHHGVGLSAASRILSNMLQAKEFDQLLLDILHSGLVGEIVFASPFSSDVLETAYKKAEKKSQDPNEGKYSRYVFIGVEQFDGNLQVVRIPLRRIPEGMTKTEMIPLMFGLVASALSLDIRSVWHSMSANVGGTATRADAESTKDQAANKLPKQFVNKMTHELSLKFAPITCKVSFDFQDIRDLMGKFEGRELLSRVHRQELENGTISPVVALQQMEQFGFISPEQADLINVQARIQGAPRNAGEVAALLRELKKSLNPVSYKQLERDYRLELDRLVNELSEGIISPEEFEDAVEELTRSAMVAAFLEGSEKAAFELDTDDYSILRTEVDILRESLPGLLELIEETPPENRSAENFSARLDLWEGFLGRVREVGKIFQVDQTKILTWVRNPLKDSCTDCVRLDGVSRTVAEWKQFALDTGFYPRSISLACSGFNCGCSLL